MGGLIYIFTQPMVNFPIGFVGFHPVTQVTLYHLDLSYNNLGSTSCQAVLVFFWCYGKRQVFFGCFIMIVTKIATSSLWIDVCVYVDTQKGYIYIYMHIFTSMYNKGPIPPKSNMAKS